MTRAPASRAIGTKLHAMYGKRLREEHYEALLRGRSVGEIAGYLKNETRFGACLGNMQEATIHRGQLEALLGRALFDEVARLRKYDRTGQIFALYERKLELKLITDCVGCLREGRQEQFLKSVPGYLIGRLRLDIDGMVRAKTAEQLAAVLAHTQYGKAFRALLTQEGGALPQASVCAAQLGACCYAAALQGARAAYRGEESQTLCHLILAQVETTNLTVVYRMKKYFGASAEQIRACLIPLYGEVRRRTIERLLAAPSAAEFETILRATHAGRSLTAEDFSFIEFSTQQKRLRMNHRAFLFATSPAVAFLAFLTMREIELQNVLTIVEGARYGVPADEIRKLLILL